MKIESSRWGRAFLFGVLAEAATVVCIIITVLIYSKVVARGLLPDEYETFGQEAGRVVGLSLGTLFVFLLAWPVVRAISKNRIYHGLVVALGAIAFQLAGSMAGHGGLPVAYAYSIALKLAAGAAAGALARRVPIVAGI